MILAEACLASLNQELSSPMEMERFRPNIVINGLHAFEEVSLICQPDQLMFSLLLVLYIRIFFYKEFNSTIIIYYEVQCFSESTICNYYFVK